MSKHGQHFAQLLTLVSVKPPLVAECERPEGSIRQLKEWREHLVKNRQQIIGKPGIYLDRSATGLGKSTADIEAVRLIPRGLIVVPTHENADEVQRDMQAAGLSANKFPARKTQRDDANCWNTWADDANNMGLSVVASVCPRCHCRSKCLQDGYLAQITTAGDSPIIIVTHARAIHSGLDQLSLGREEYIAIHENPVGVISPDAVVSSNDLQKAADTLHGLTDKLTYSDSSTQLSMEVEVRDSTQDQKPSEKSIIVMEFLRHITSLVTSSINELNSSVKTKAIEISTRSKKPFGIEELLFRATLEVETKFTTKPWRLLLAAASGELASFGVVVDDSSAKGNRTDRSPKEKVLFGIWKNLPNEDGVFLIADATTRLDDLKSCVGRSIDDITPEGHVELAKRVVQFPKDITRKTAPNSFLGSVRAVMYKFPEARRVGIITHRTLLKHLDNIGDPFFARIGKKDYFGSGSDRASNDWYKQCDLIIVAGTPRVSSLAIQRRLIQLYGFRATEEPPDWGDVVWIGRTESGTTSPIKNRSYRNSNWAKAHRNVVRASIVQAAGRGRPLLDSGCPVAIISTEECGFPVVEEPNWKLMQTELKVLNILSRASAENLTSGSLKAVDPYILNKTTPPITLPMANLPPINHPMSTKELSLSIDLSERQTRDILSGLEVRRLIQRVGKRGGWTISTQANS